MQGEWRELLEAARGAANKKTVRKELNEEEEQQKVLREAVRLVRLGELSKARQALLAAKLAPGTQETLDKLNNPEKRPPRALVPLSEEVLNTQPDTPVRLNKGLFLNNVRAAPRGSSAALSGWRNEHWKVLLDHEGSTDLLYLVAAEVAKGNLLEGLAKVLTSGQLVALQKDDGGVRGIVAGETLRRLVARTLAQQFGEELEKECSPYQFALSTRAGTECVSHMIRAATDMDPTLTILSVDEMSAYDLMRRQAMLSKLARRPKLRGLLPFVRMSYGQPSRYY